MSYTRLPEEFSASSCVWLLGFISAYVIFSEPSDNLVFGFVSAAWTHSWFIFLTIFQAYLSYYFYSLKFSWGEVLLWPLYNIQSLPVSNTLYYFIFFLRIIILEFLSNLLLFLLVSARLSLFNSDLLEADVLAVSTCSFVLYRLPRTVPGGKKPNCGLSENLRY